MSVDYPNGPGRGHIGSPGDPQLQTPWKAPEHIWIDGRLAYATGDSVPEDVARSLGLIDEPKKRTPAENKKREAPATKKATAPRKRATPKE